MNNYENDIMKDQLRDPRKEDSFNEDLINLINQEYTYIIITNSIESDYLQTYIYKHLINI